MITLYSFRPRERKLLRLGLLRGVNYHQDLLVAQGEFVFLLLTFWKVNHSHILSQQCAINITCLLFSLLTAFLAGPLCVLTSSAAVQSLFTVYL